LSLNREGLTGHRDLRDLNGRSALVGDGEAIDLAFANRNLAEGYGIGRWHKKAGERFLDDDPAAAGEGDGAGNGEKKSQAAAERSTAVTLARLSRERLFDRRGAVTRLRFRVAIREFSHLCFLSKPSSVVDSFHEVSYPRSKWHEAAL
jgi:hypothetical protein